METTEIENIELDLLLETLFRRHGYDFRNYSRASLKRRIYKFLPRADCRRPAELIPRLLDDKSLLEPLVYSISVTVTEMFRDPWVYRAIREKVVPLLKTYPFLKIWHAGCATGQEVYSMAILLEEAGLSDKTQLYATDINNDALQTAREGIYPIERVSI